MDKDSWPGEEKGRGTTTRLTTIDIPSPSSQFIHCHAISVQIDK